MFENLNKKEIKVKTEKEALDLFVKYNSKEYLNKFATLTKSKEKGGDRTYIISIYEFSKK